MEVAYINFNLQQLALPVVTLIGPPGAGKTTVGDLLAKDLNWTFWDTDSLIQEASGMRVTQIFSRHGEKVFRLLEKKLVAEILHLYKCAGGNASQEQTKGTVISTGGGLPVPLEHFTGLTTIGSIVSLYASIDVLLERIGQIQNRPLLNSVRAKDNGLGHRGEEDKKRANLQSLLDERQGIYEQAKLSVDTSKLSPDAAVQWIKKKLDLIN